MTEEKNITTEELIQELKGFDPKAPVWVYAKGFNAGDSWAAPVTKIGKDMATVKYNEEEERVEIGFFTI